MPRRSPGGNDSPYENRRPKKGFPQICREAFFVFETQFANREKVEFVMKKPVFVEKIFFGLAPNLFLLRKL